MKYPLARPMRRRPAYRAPIEVVAIMMTFEAQHKMQASHRHCLLPSFAAAKPAPPEETNAPRVMRDEINCCRSGAMFQPLALFVDL